MALPSKQRGLLLVYAMPVLLLACGLTTGFDVYDTTPPTYKVGGKVTGLEGSDNAYLRLNGGPDLTVGNAAFVFPTQLADGAPYVVDVDTSATVAKCTVSNGSGTIAGSDVTNVLVNCGSGKSALATIALSAPPASVGPLVPPFSFGDHFNFSALVKLPVLPQVVSNPTLQIFAPPQDAHAIVAPAFSSPDTGNPSPLTPCPTPETSCWFGVLPSGRTQLNITVTAPDGQTTSTYIVILTSVWSHYLKPSNNRQIPFGGAKMAFGSAV